MELSGKKVTVMGLGRFGGGVGVTRWLAARGADVLVTDMEPEEKLADSVGEIRELVDSGAVTLRLGEHNVSDFTTCDLVVANVAVPKPWDNRFIRAAEAAGIPVTTEIALFLSRLPAGSRVRERTIGITGSAGKSTTTAMIHHALRHAVKGRGRGERVLLGGNIGVSLLDDLDSMDDSTWLVLELSSAMLYWIARTMNGSAAWSPRVGVVTNISPNHIDWHGEMGHYSSSKQELMKHQRVGDSAILGASVWDWRSSTPATAVKVDAQSFTRELKLPGAHNRENAAAAMAACRAAMPDVPAEVFESAIASFSGLPHRLQLVAEKRPAGSGEPMRFYNDSKSTTPESCLKAIEALAGMPGFAASRIHLIAGGYDKGSDLSPISHAAARLGGLYTIGKTGPSLAAGAGGRAVEGGTLDRAFASAMERMKAGDALLMSPGCASWDQFINYEKRGEAFIRLVEGLS